MAAGDLENIVLTSPDSAAQKSARVRNIIWRDETNVNRSVKEVYWCPDGVTAKLVWQRDHSPIGPQYTTIKIDNVETNRAIAVKYVATSQPITTIEILTHFQGTMNNPCIFIYNSTMTSSQKITYSSNDASFTAEEVSLDNVTTNVYNYTINNLNIQLNDGETYYIYAGMQYADNAQYHATPLVEKNTNTGNYKILTGEDWSFDNPTFTSIVDSERPIVKFNGVQV